MTAHSISILSELKMSTLTRTPAQRRALHQLRYQLNSVEGRSKCPIVAQRRVLVTDTRAAKQGSK